MGDKEDQISCVGPTSPNSHNIKTSLTTAQFFDEEPWILAFMWIYLTQTLSLNMTPTCPSDIDPQQNDECCHSTEMALEQPEEHDQELRLSSSQTPHDDQDPRFS